jgi:allophanate hydrolase
MVRVAVVGAHLSGMPLNGQLTERGARLVSRTQTAPDYRLYALPGTTPPKPGLLRVARRQGGAIADRGLGDARGALRQLRRADACAAGHRHADSWPTAASVQGFLCEPLALQGCAGHHPPGRLARLHRRSKPHA